MKFKKSTTYLVFAAAILVIGITPAHSAIVKNGAKCVKEGQIAKVGSKSFTCTNFRGSLLWADKTWAPAGSNPNAYNNSYDLLMSYSDNRLWNLNYANVFNGSFANRQWAMNWCDDYFVTPSVFGRYYSYSTRDINSAILGCTDAVMRRDG